MFCWWMYCQMVQLGPVRQRGTRAAIRPCACARCRASTAPGAGASDPSDADCCGRRRCAPWHATSLHRDARHRRRHRNRICRAPGRSACVFITSVCTARAMREGSDAARQAPPGWYAPAARGRAASPSHRENAIISRNFHVVSTCSSGKGGFAGWKAFIARCSITELSLPMGVQHHRLFALRDHLAHDVDGFGFEVVAGVSGDLCCSLVRLRTRPRGGRL